RAGAPSGDHFRDTVDAARVPKSAGTGVACRGGVPGLRGPRSDPRLPDGAAVDAVFAPRMAALGPGGCRRLPVLRRVDPCDDRISPALWLGARARAARPHPLALARRILGLPLEPGGG